MGSPIKQTMGWLHWGNSSFIIIPLSKSYNSMECPFSLHTLNSWWALGCNFLFRTRSQAQSVDIPQQQRVPAVTVPFCPQKGNPSTLPVPRLLWNGDGLGRRGGQCQGLLSVLPSPADHLPQENHILKCPSLTLVTHSSHWRASNCSPSTLEKICLEIEIYQLLLCPR